MIESDKVTRGSDKVIFTVMQKNNAWKLSNSKAKLNQFYRKNLNDVLNFQRRYAETVGADYHFYHGDLVSFVKKRFPAIHNFKLFVQYYDFARYIIMDELCDERYKKVLYIDSDIVPVTKESIFDYINDENTFYTHWFHEETCPFFKEMQQYIRYIKPGNYIYRGHTNTGVLGSRGYAVRTFFRQHFDEMMKFYKTIDSHYHPEHIMYIGFEHFFMYLVGTNQLQIKLKTFPPRGWNVYAMDGFCPQIKELMDKKHLNAYKFLHFCGDEAKKWYETQKEDLFKLIDYKMGDKHEHRE